MGETCSTQGDMRSTYNIFVRKPEGKRSLWRPKRRWKLNIKMDVK